MCYAGPDIADRTLVHRLVEAIGFRAVWLGADASAFALTDDLAQLWFQLVFHRSWPRGLGLRLLTGDEGRDPLLSEN